MRRLAKPLVFLLIAAQLLLTVPATAAVSVATVGATRTHCDGMAMHEDMHARHSCPCCPEGAVSMTDCLVSCMLGAVATPVISPVRVVTRHAPTYLELAFSVDSFSSPPLKPPPIA